jgi:hypothetical protein
LFSESLNESGLKNYTTYYFIIIAIDIKNNTDKESDAPNCSSAKDHNKNTHVIKETISNELKQREKQPKSNNTDHCAKTNEKKALANDADGEGQAISNFGAVDRKYCKYSDNHL